ncbi:MAG: DNA-directed RNA polymerase subunit beta [Candidatus Coatesbacteria bacterium]|nr:MAG: DNA-directed RNA polymerase subunit beta [Candidatus Coatesbacteria bacterium]
MCKGGGIVKNNGYKIVDFTKFKATVEPPNLLEVQLRSYEDFFQANVSPVKRKNEGLQLVFLETFPIYDLNEDSYLEFVKYWIETPKYTKDECRERGMTYSNPIWATVRLVVRERDQENGSLKVKDIREEDIYLGEFPRMTEEGTFIVNGAERVVVSQLHRSPGVIFSEKPHPSGRYLFSASVIPYQGSWLELYTDMNDVCYFTIDRKKKFPITLLLRALGYETDKDILELFYEKKNIRVSSIDFDSNEEYYLAEDVSSESDDTVFIKAGTLINEQLLRIITELNIERVDVFIVGSDEGDRLIIMSMAKDDTTNKEEALIKLYQALRPGDIPNIQSAEIKFNNLFFNPQFYNLERIGRKKINEKFGMNIDEKQTALTKEDIVEVVRGLIEMVSGKREPDDVDHLGNRRAKTVGELLYNRFQNGMRRLKQVTKERMSIKNVEECMPRDLINTKPLVAAVVEFFGTSQLSQFLDQVNPLAELTHKRRLSALGPGGLSRERAGFEVRDVHYTHYGRVCPIETPEGPNIGLIMSLATYARVNEYGLIETPYRVVKDGVVQNKIEYLSADDEDRYTIAQIDSDVDSKGKLKGPLILARRKSDFPWVSPLEVNYIDISPIQMVSISSSLIPFLEHDDANRALMGSNMQRQAVPLLTPEVPLVSTGMEEKVARDSGVVVVAENPGEVVEVSSEYIKIKRSGTDTEEYLADLVEETDVDFYRLKKFKRTNQDTCYNQVPLVKKGDRVKKGDIIADGPATKNGKLALGQNVLVAFMPWMGYNFEDAIVISERLLKDDVFTSIHIEEFELECRETKLGPEEITRDIPNVSSDAVKNLDKDGIIMVGAPVKPGDILIGKVTPKGETELLAEEKLLKAIFGEKAGEVRDASLKAPPGLEGWVVNVQVFEQKEAVSPKKRAKELLRIKEMEEEVERKRKKLKRSRDKCLENILIGAIPKVDIKDYETGDVIHKKGLKISERDFKEKLLLPIVEGRLSMEANLERKIDRILMVYREKIGELKASFGKQVDAIRKGDELPPGVLKRVKVYVARKRKISVGDKISGRHGNKGVISKILPVEDMPYLEDGTPIDIILDPLGVPSRMNIGQLLETHLGWTAHNLKFVAVSPIFSGATEQDIKGYLKKANLPENGQTVLYDGRTGDRFDEKITVGWMYIMKLNHLADDKIHMRAVGPYSLITQQPLGGKSQMGGQRFGEMEVWALEAYGAAYTLQEMLTVKSDDVIGRSRMYEAIVKGRPVPEPGIPESFNVLVRELRSLCLDIEPEFEGVEEFEEQKI